MTEKNIENLLRDPVEKLGYKLVSVSFKREQGDFYVNVVVDKDAILSLDDIVKVTDVISPLLDDLDISDSNYFLDVSSLGAEKPIDVSKIENYVGQYANIHVINAVNGLNYIEGTIEEANDDKVIISYREKTRVKKIEVNRSNIDKARLAIKF